MIAVRALSRETLRVPALWRILIGRRGVDYHPVDHRFEDRLSMIGVC